MFPRELELLDQAHNQDLVIGAGSVRCGGGIPKLLLVGPVPPAVGALTNPMGGTAVNFAEMVNQLGARGFDVSVVDITRARVNLRRWQVWRNNLATVVRVLRQVVVRIQRCNLVVLNISAGTAWTLGSCLWVLCKICRRPMVLRIFGGDFAARYGRYGRLIRWWADQTYMRCALVFVQTREIFRRFQNHKNVRWFANTRDVCSPTVEQRLPISRFVFISQLRMEKGLRETLDACRELPAHCELNVYGPLMPNTDLSLFDSHPTATYRGVLMPSAVPEVLVQHDVLLLPTYWESEGYPGIVLEALQCGRPVIATWWGSIPEVVEDEKSGLLVEPRSAKAVNGAMERLLNDGELYRRLCRGARARGEVFRSGVWYDMMATEIRRLIGGT